MPTLVRAPSAPRASSQLPPPTTLAEAGLSLDLVTQLVIKILHFSGELTGAELANRLGVIFAIVEPAIEFLKVQRYCEIVSGTMIGGSSYTYRITSEGRRAAALFLQQNQYVGVAPVPLKQYATYMAAHKRETVTTLSREGAREALSNLVLSDTVIDEIAASINGGHSVFIYGPPGNGKSIIARAIRDLFAGDVAIPHALEVEGNIVRILDPINHEERPWIEDSCLSRYPSMDRRWRICRRPVVVAGGELRIDALELSYDPKLGYYRAPLQLVANGGMLVIDDFGRQNCAPHDLLNRWMVPLENGVDYLTLQSGVKFEVPFYVFVAFATNLKPSELVDEAFLRRVQYKVFAENPSRENFGEIFRRFCQARDIPHDEELPNQLLDGYYRRHAVTPRACHPRDLINQAMQIASYRLADRVLTLELLEAACTNYFIHDRE